MRKRASLFLFIGAVALQVLVLAAIPAQKARAIFDGRTIYLKVGPIDPYSILSGYYATLRFDINSFSFEHSRALETKPRTVYLTLKKGANGLWEGVRLDDALPTNLPPDQVVLRGRIVKSCWIQLYGLEQFHFPEAQRDEINQGLSQRNADIRAEVKVDRSGGSVLQAIIINGRVYR